MDWSWKRQRSWQQSNGVEFMTAYSAWWPTEQEPQRVLTNNLSFEFYWSINVMDVKTPAKVSSCVENAKGWNKGDYSVSVENQPKHGENAWNAEEWNRWTSKTNVDGIYAIGDVVKAPCTEETCMLLNKSGQKPHNLIPGAERIETDEHLKCTK